MLIVRCNDNFLQDRLYIYNVVFSDFWNIKFKIIYEKRNDLSLEYNGVVLYINDFFFQQDESIWLKPTSLPVQPLRSFQIEEPYSSTIVDRFLPIIYGDKDAKSIFDNNKYYCSIDVFGSAFFMLTRYEEIVKKDRDIFGRFPAQSSLAYQEGFLERPIINEYLDLLWAWIKQYFPNLKRCSRSYSVMPTHDIDTPYWSLLLHGYAKYRSLLGDIIKRKSPALMFKNIKLYEEASVGNFTHDPYNTFDIIMDINEKYGLVSNFYFMTSQGRSEKDGNYDVLSRPIVNLARRILERGHNIVIHPGFGSYNNYKWIKQDVDKLCNMIKRNEFNVQEVGGRQHYLLWEAPETWKYYNDVGITYDTTLSYADHIGFRCGVCYDYPVYNVITHETYKLREIPLTVMECSGLDYMGLTHEQMKNRCILLKNMCRKYKGTFVILWHNTSFVDSLEKQLYSEILES